MHPSLMLRLLPLADATLVADRLTVHAARAAMAVLAVASGVGLATYVVLAAGFAALP